MNQPSANALRGSGVGETLQGRRLRQAHTEMVSDGDQRSARNDSAVDQQVHRCIDFLVQNDCFALAHVQETLGFDVGTSKDHFDGDLQLPQEAQVQAERLGLLLFIGRDGHEFDDVGGGFHDSSMLDDAIDEAERAISGLLAQRAFGQR